jgi:hypothetical protein
VPFGERTSMTFSVFLLISYSDTQAQLQTASAEDFFNRFAALSCHFRGGVDVLQGV